MTDEQIDAVWDSVPWKDLNVNSLEHVRVLRRRFARALLSAGPVPSVGPIIDAKASHNDAAITACAVIIKGICLTKPQDTWTAEIERRIRFMLGQSPTSAIKSAVDDGSQDTSVLDAASMAAEAERQFAHLKPVPQDGGERVHHFAELCDMLPESTSWGDALTPDIARHIAKAALAQKAVPAAVEPNTLPQAVLDALRFYAHGHHFNIDADHQQFDTVSSEPQNWLMSEKDDDCTMIEDGSVAKAVLLGGLPGFEEPTEPLEGEVFTAHAFDLTQRFADRATAEPDSDFIVCEPSPAPIASAEEAALRDAVAYVAPFDLDVLVSGHQQSIKARLTRFPTRTRTIALYIGTHSAAAQPSRAEVLTDEQRTAVEKGVGLLWGMGQCKAANDLRSLLTPPQSGGDES